jgi:chromosome segregation ATPase
MTPPHESQRSPAPRGAVWAVRRALAPAALEMQGRAERLAEENDDLRRRVDRLEEQVRAAEERLTTAHRQIDELRGGLHESRRLNLRIAELTDLVTELVLPLHDREIEPSMLRSLRPDTL